MKIFLLAFILIFSGCDIREREMALEKKEKALHQKEQELLLKEKTLELKEENLLREQQKRDSSFLADSVRMMYNRDIVGNWDVVMNCVETTCPGSAIGDTKNETWNISYVGNTVLAKAMTNNQLLRVYTGNFNNGHFELLERSAATGSLPATKITVRFQLLDSTSMEGQREIAREGSCKIVYDLKMTKD